MGAAEDNRKKIEAAKERAQGDWDSGKKRVDDGKKSSMPRSAGWLSSRRRN